MGSRGSCFRSDLVASALRNKKKLESNFGHDHLHPLVLMLWTSVLQAQWKRRSMFTREARWRDYKYVWSISPHVFAVWFESLSLGMSAVPHTKPQKCAASGLILFSSSLSIKTRAIRQDSTWASLKLFQTSFVSANMARQKMLESPTSCLFRNQFKEKRYLGWECSSLSGKVMNICLVICLVQPEP